MSYDGASNRELAGHVVQCKNNPRACEDRMDAGEHAAAPQPRSAFVLKVVWRCFILDFNSYVEMFVFSFLTIYCLFFHMWWFILISGDLNPTRASEGEGGGCSVRSQASFALCVFRRVKDHHHLRSHSPRSKNTCARRVVLDRTPSSTRARRTRMAEGAGSPGASSSTQTCRTCAVPSFSRDFFFGTVDLPLT